MHGIKEINWQNEHQEAQRILAKHNERNIDQEYLVRQQALDNYLKEKYGTQ